MPPGCTWLLLLRAMSMNSKRGPRCFGPALETCHRAVAAYVMGSLTRTHDLLVGAGIAGAEWDPISFRRSAIEPHPQDADSSGIDIVIDVARDVLEFALREHPSVAHALMTLWENSTAPVLRRLAIHGRIENPALVPREELDRVLANGWLDAFSLKHEVFRLLAIAYARADETARTGFLEAALAAMTPAQPSPDPDEDLTERYEAYNLLVWLWRAAPDSTITQARLAAAQAANPGSANENIPT